ncbi:MAG TPA: hypothetical protein VE934_08790 [Polaromonas sp.]|uniref:hypothetical protein n=1 Tax=Polaromonas sp. TaxID=1869339 RepID=UPI002D3655D8|nr:hypothetical protein [Polaromonas sp.]HYW57045.1 hypothetical protein [Polaromonas sp.]
MDFSTISRLLASAAAPLLGFLKKPWAERTAVLNPGQATSSPIDDLDEATFANLGATTPDAAGWKLVLQVFLRQLVMAEPFSLPHVREWLDLEETQRHLQRLAHARITAASEPSSERSALVESYMLASGEHQSRADDIVEHALKVLVAGVYGGLKDTALGAILQVSMRALQERLDELDMRVGEQRLPELGWSLEAACKANENWLLESFSSQRKAKTRLGQPLNPADGMARVHPIARTNLIESFESLLRESPFGGVVAVTGDEGNGKSWLVAQAWLSLSAKPLTLFLTAENVSDQVADPIALIARNLCVQTGREGVESHQEFWTTQWNTWRAQRQGPAQGIIVVLDGLNQRPRTEWARFIDKLSEELEFIGGKLIVTSRKRYFDGTVKARLASPCRELRVPEWTPTERDALLVASGTLGGQLHERVANSLRNPRLLGIALTLLDSAQLQAMEELSVPLLLFEHLRTSQRDTYDLSAEHFKRNLQDHARQVLQRLNTQQRDDLKVFEGGLDAVVEGRFFTPLAEDPTRYAVREEGLGLALGLAILDELVSARRNGRDLGEALATIAEPIVALDLTSEAMLAAMTVVCMSEEYPTEIGVAILIAFASLQNPDDDAFDSVAALARIQPLVFLESARLLALQGGRVPNFDWIELALHKAKTDNHAWESISTAIKVWLAHVTLDIEKQIFSTGKTPEEIAQLRTERRNALDAKLEKLSLGEREVFNSLNRTTAQDTSLLGRVAIKLLAGMPLAPFSQGLVQWKFANSLNGSYDAPNKELRQLIRFNSIDWVAAREALLHSSQTLRNKVTSTVGRWALVSLLDATGNQEDAQYAQELADVLRAGQPRRQGWRLVEKYCSTDPCDPNNREPENVAQTTGQYQAVDVTKLHQRMGMDVLDHFFSKARPAICRYNKDTAVERHRALIDDVLRRSGPPLRQGVVSLLAHSSLITHAQSLALVRRVCGSEADSDALRSLGDEASIWAQFHLQLAFPSLEASAQFDSLLQMRCGSRLSLNLVEIIKPLDKKSFNEKLTSAITSGDEEAVFTTLLFSPFVDELLPPETRNHVAKLLRSKSTLVRAYALRMVGQSGDRDALQIVLQEEWSHAHLGKDEKMERWYGSEVLLEAAVKGVAPWETLVPSMEYQHLGSLSQSLRGAAVQFVAGLVDALLRLSLKLPVEASMLEIELMRHPAAAPQMQYFRLHAHQTLSDDPFEALRLASEDNDSFNERQKKLQDAFERMVANLTRLDAGRLLDQFRMDDFSVIAEADISLTDSWCALLLTPPDGAHLAAVRNMGLLIARAIATRDPVRSVQLFEKYEPILPMVRVVFGHSSIELGAMAIWSAPDNHQLDALRARRLDQAANNEDLAQEVWAALWNGKSGKLRLYIDERLDSLWPAMQARAILVAGLMGENSHSSSVMARFDGVPGLLGETQHVAREVHERHVWAEHWFAAMRVARSAEDFWSAAVLFLVVVDGRFEVLRSSEEEAQEPFRLHWPAIERQLKNRFDKLRGKWKDRLLNEDRPWQQFLAQQLLR